MHVTCQNITLYIYIIGKMYAVELGIGAAKGDQASKTYILGLMDELSQVIISN